MYIRLNRDAETELAQSLAKDLAVAPLNADRRTASPLAERKVPPALAAAYLVLRAYKAASARGFGVAMAELVLAVGLTKLVREARRILGRLPQLPRPRAQQQRPTRPDRAAAIDNLFATAPAVTFGRLLRACGAQLI